MRHIICGWVLLIGIAGCGGSSPPPAEIAPPPQVETIPPPQIGTEPLPPAQIRTFTLIPQHAGVLLGTGQVAGELPVSAQVSAAAPVGAATILTAQAANFSPGELVVLLGEDGDYHSEKVQAIAEASITLSRPLSYQVAGSTLWCFYTDFVPPTTAGYYAIADYAYAAVGPITGGTHGGIA